MRLLIALALVSLFSGPSGANPYAEAERAVSRQAEKSFCRGEGENCNTNLDCCLGSCRIRVCRSDMHPPIPCKPRGSYCRSGIDCCSRVCIGKCQ